MVAQAAMGSRTRLAYVVVPQDGMVRRYKTAFVKGKGLVKELYEEPAGYMVFFPRGHVIRFRDKKGLRRYNLHKKPKMANLAGLNDPASPLGRLLMAQDDQGRQDAYRDLENEVIQLATVKTGPNLLTKVEVLEERPTIAPDDVAVARKVEEDEPSVDEPPVASKRRKTHD